jgi:pyridinium-3,5-bisthiocarboxylic acid mononucleotide nickel chelatase
MILAALAAVGADLQAIERQINAFFPAGIRITEEAATGSGLNGIRIRVSAHHHHNTAHWPDAEPDAPDRIADHHNNSCHHSHHHRNLNEILALLNASSLTAKSRTLAATVFRKLAEAEAKIHDKTPESVHFHEVGAWDSLADIVGACLALEQLDISGISCSALPCGTGTIRCAHGEMPNPAPATQLLLQGLPVIQTDESAELVTPTGAALLATWLEVLETPPFETVPRASGFGFGSSQLDHRPNVLRATIQESPVGRHFTTITTSYGEPQSADNHLVLESNLDDCNPEWLGAVIDELLQAEALDVWHTPILMKKGRPAVKLSVLVNAASADRCREIIFRSTTTFGIRSYAVKKTELERETIEVETQWGAIPVKCGRFNGRIITISPEHECCAKAAAANNLTLREVSESVRSIASKDKR